MGGSRVYLGRLSHRANEKDIERFFKSYGRVSEIMMKNGYAFIEFENYKDADDAVYDLNGKEICGERVIVEHAKGTPRGEDYRRDTERGYDFPRRGGAGGRGDGRYGPPQRSEYRIKVENLSSSVSWQDLKDHMRDVGEVMYADAHRERKNEGVVEFSSRREMQRAVEKMDDTELAGRRIRVSEAKSRSKRSRSRSRSASGGKRRKSESKSRSRSPPKSKSYTKSGSGVRSRSPAKVNRRSSSSD